MSNEMDNFADLIDYSDGSTPVAPVDSPESTPVIPAQAAVPAAEKVPAPPAPAPTPAAAAAPVDVEDDDDDEDWDDDERHPMVYRLRRLVVKVVLTGLVLGGAFFAYQNWGPTVFSQTEAPGGSARGDLQMVPPSEEELASATQQVEVILGQARAWQVQKDSFTGFYHEGSRVATAESVLMLSTVIDGRCYYSGIIPGQSVPVLHDETAQACTDQMINETQAALDTQVAATEADSSDTAAVQLARAVETVQYYALNNFVDGVPSFEGITTSAVEGVSIVSITPGYVLLSAQAGENCLVTEVGYDSATEPVPADCIG